MIRIGSGFDIHKIGKKNVYENPFILGGIKISEEISVKAHSDGDTLIHSLIDAFLGALGLDDIGEYFPNTKDDYKQVDSFILLSKIISFPEYKEKWEIGNIDITVVLEKPKLAEKKQEIKEKLAHFLGIEENQISIKAKTFEDPSKVEEIWVYCTLLLFRKLIK